jgi:hypothetical protein
MYRGKTNKLKTSSTAVVHIVSATDKLTDINKKYYCPLSFSATTAIKTTHK